MRALPGKVFFRIDRPPEPWCELPPHVFHEIPRADAEALKDCFGCGEICEDDRAPEWWRAMVLKGGLDIG
jgi:hypothetical protein